MEQCLRGHNIRNKICLRKQAGRGRVRGRSSWCREIWWGGRWWRSERCSVWWTEWRKVNNLAPLQQEVRSLATAAQFDRCGWCAAVQKTSSLFLRPTNVLGLLGARALLFQLNGTFHWITPSTLSQALHCDGGVQTRLRHSWKETEIQVFNKYLSAS